MGAFVFVLFFVFGTIVGSFLNVLIDRIDTKESPFRGRSFCPYCQKTLSWWEMVPIVNFFYLKGKCFTCHHKLPLQYPLVEFLTGLSFALISWRFFHFPLINFYVMFSLNLESVLLWINFIFWLYWVFVLLAISVYDLKKYLILNEVLFPAIIISFIWRIVLGIFLQFKDFTFLAQTTNFLGPQTYIFGHYSYFASLFLGGVVGGGLIAAFAYLTKERAMGWGDAILAFFIGLILGWPDILIALILSFLSGGLISLILIILKRKTFKSYIPFAPFLSLGALLVMLFGDIIIKGYLSIPLI